VHKLRVGGTNPQLSVRGLPPTSLPAVRSLRMRPTVRRVAGVQPMPPGHSNTANARRAVRRLRKQTSTDRQ